MAIAPTGAIYKALKFDGVSSRTYGVYITGEAVYNAPERDVEMITIPGRNGSFALDNGRFENIEVSYPAGIFAETEADFRAAISDFRNFLCSRKGYVRLQDEYNPDEYRMAVYKSGLEVDPAMLKAGEFTITFDCKPQRWLTSGESEITIGEWSEYETATGDIVEIEASETDAVKSLVADIEPIQSGSGTPSPDNVRPISGHTDVVVSRTGKNLLDPSLLENKQLDVNTGERTSASTRASFVSKIPPVQKITVSVNSPFQIGSAVYYNADGSYMTKETLDAWTDGSYTFTVPSGAGYFCTNFRKSDNGNVNLSDLQVQMEVGTTATDYEPYGDTYTIALGTTVYGGSLDVTTGTLTVDRSVKTFNGTESWTILTTDKNAYFFSSLPNTYLMSNSKTPILCDTFETRADDKPTTYSDGTAWYIYRQIHLKVGENIAPSGLTSQGVAELKAWLANNPITVVLPLATPTTVQLTAEEVDTLLGTNNVWASSGDVTLEYGQNPNVIINPTLFESSPLLEVEGYGSIGFNGYEIELINEVMGEVLLADETSRASAGISLVLAKNIMNNGDTFVTYPSTLYWSIGLKTAKSVTISSVSDSDASVETVQAGNGYYTNIPMLGGTYGTASVLLTNITTITGTYVSLSDTTQSFTITLTTKVSYTVGSIHRYQFTRSVGLPASLSMNFYEYPSTFGRMVGDSTVSILGHPTKVDCDLGEAYKEVNGELVSLNAYIDLGSDLPTLASGANTITYDNTVTDLKIVPRWWIV